MRIKKILFYYIVLLTLVLGCQSVQMMKKKEPVKTKSPSVVKQKFFEIRNST